MDLEQTHTDPACRRISSENLFRCKHVDQQRGDTELDVVCFVWTTSKTNFVIMVTS